MTVQVAIDLSSVQGKGSLPDFRTQEQTSMQRPKTKVFCPYVYCSGDGVGMKTSGANREIRI